MISELQKLPIDKDCERAIDTGDYGYFSDPLVEYIFKYIDTHHPHCEFLHDLGVPYGVFLITFMQRYSNNQIDTSAKAAFESNNDITSTVELMGYELDKFWYLVLFLYDYSKGYCKDALITHKSPKNTLSEFTDKILKNIENLDSDNLGHTSYKDPMSITLKVGRKKLVIDQPDSITFILAAIVRGEKQLEHAAGIDSSRGKWGNEKIVREPLSDSAHICHFHSLMNKFIKTQPPKITKAPNGSTVSVGKNLLISRLAHTLGLTSNKNFLDSEENLKGIIKQYKGKIGGSDRINGYYSY